MSASVTVQIKALIVIHFWEILCTSTDTLHIATGLQWEVHCNLLVRSVLNTLTF